MPRTAAPDASPNATLCITSVVPSASGAAPVGAPPAPAVTASASPPAPSAPSAESLDRATPTLPSPL
ncbi:MAG: hypothetical protein ABJF10_28875, partial [Chthoniobacter sp.]